MILPVEYKIQGTPKTAVFILVYQNATMAKAAIQSFQETVKIPNVELILVHHIRPSEHEKAENVAKLITSLPYRNLVIKSDKFNYPRLMNEAISRFRGDFNFFIHMNDDIVLWPKAIEQMIAVATSDEKIGIVGAKLMFPPKRGDLTSPASWIENIHPMQHFGVKINKETLTAHHVNAYKPGNSPDCQTVKDVDAVTFALALVRREIFDTMAMDEQFASDYNDIAYCLEAHKMGRRVVVCPSAMAFHRQSATRKLYGLNSVQSDYILFAQRYGEFIRGR